MLFQVDIDNVFFVAALVAALGAGLAALQLGAHRDAFSGLWVGYAVAQSLSCFFQSIRGQLPDVLSFGLGSGFLLIALCFLWCGARRLRGRTIPTFIAFAPAVVWLALFLPGTAPPILERQLLLSPMLIFLLGATTFELWRAGRDLGLRGALALAPIIGLVAMAAVFHLVWLIFAAPFGIWVITALAMVVLSTVVPFMTLAIAHELAAIRAARAETAAMLAGRADIERLHTGLPAVIFLRDVAPNGSSRLLYSGGDSEAVSGYPAAQVRDLQSLQDCEPSEGRPLAAHLLEALRRGEVRDDWRLQQPDGAWRNMRSYSRLLRRGTDGGGEVGGYTLDVTAERVAEARATASIRLASLGEIASGLAHELRQPLSAISLGAEIAQIEARRAGAALAADRLDAVVEQTERASRIIEMLRRFAREPEASTPAQPLPLTDLVANTLALTGSWFREVGAEVICDLGNPAPFVLAEQVAVEQVLVNLLCNARDALMTRPPEFPRWVRIAAEPDTGTQSVRITLEDSGGGISPRVMDRLFEPFVTTKGPDQGTGLGLSICDGLLRSMGGTITASNEAQGARFTIMLPAAFGEAEGGLPAVAPSASPLGQ